MTVAVKAPARALDPSPDCQKCPRLVSYREDNRARYPDKYNAVVPAFGDIDARLLVVGLAPGLKGANFSGRPFTGDFAGDLLYKTLLDFGFATGTYGGRADDGLSLVDARITNAVRCVPQENKPTTAEINQCLPFLEQELAAMAELEVIVSLGLVSHKAVIKAFGQRQSAFKFGHGTRFSLPHPANPDQTVTLLDSYHCSRYNTNTGRLTEEMFQDIFKMARELID